MLTKAQDEFLAAILDDIDENILLDRASAQLREKIAARIEAYDAESAASYKRELTANFPMLLGEVFGI